MDVDFSLTQNHPDSADRCDIAVIGGGAAGLMAAISAAMAAQEQDLPFRIVILEAQERVGRKLLATGNGRCNLSHVNWEPEHYHGRDPRFALGALKRLDVALTLDVFRQMGLLCRVDEDGRIFPYSLQASSVLDILRLRLERLGVLTQTSFKVDRLTAPANTAAKAPANTAAKAPANTAATASGAFRIQSTDGRLLLAESVIMATGGLAAPAFGCDGSGYSLMARLGHRLIDPFPAIVQICTPQAWVRPLSGIKCEGVASLVVDGHVQRTEKGEILFTDYGLSGPPILQLSRLVGAHVPVQDGKSHPGKPIARQAAPDLAVWIDFLPDFSVQDTIDWLAERSLADPDCPLAEFLTGLIHKKLGQALLKQAIARPLNGPCSTLTEAERHATGQLIKQWSIPAIGTRDWSQAQVTAGGLDVGQFRVQSLESRLVPGLFAAGEILDIDGDCGGFNLQWAWSSGWLAGRSAVAAAAKMANRS